MADNSPAHRIGQVSREPLDVSVRGIARELRMLVGSCRDDDNTDGGERRLDRIRRGETGPTETPGPGEDTCRRGTGRGDKRQDARTPES